VTSIVHLSLVAAIAGQLPYTEIANDAHGAYAHYFQTKFRSKEDLLALDKLPQKTNGIRMECKVSLKDGDVGSIVTVAWTLTYDGPRPPVAVLKPELRNPGGQTTLTFYAQAKDKRFYALEFAGQAHHSVQRSGKESFVVLQRGGKATGTTEIPLFSILKRFEHIEAFGKRPNPEILLVVEHRPHDRGEEAMLDAWTGRICSRVLFVPAPKERP